jgi:hypothetical protein
MYADIYIYIHIYTYIYLYAYIYTYTHVQFSGFFATIPNSKTQESLDFSLQKSIILSYIYTHKYTPNISIRISTYINIIQALLLLSPYSKTLNKY